MRERRRPGRNGRPRGRCRRRECPSGPSMFQFRIYYPAHDEKKPGSEWIRRSKLPERVDGIRRPSRSSSSEDTSKPGIPRIARPRNRMRSDASNMISPPLCGGRAEGTNTMRSRFSDSSTAGDDKVAVVDGIERAPEYSYPFRAWRHWLRWS